MKKISSELVKQLFLNENFLKEVYKEPKESKIKKLTHITKDYFSIVPLTGAVIGTGIVYLGAFAVGAAGYLTHQMVWGIDNFESIDPMLLLHQIPDGVSEFYRHGRELASNWAAAGGLTGQFLAYRFKNGVKSAMKNLLKKKR